MERSEALKRARQAMRHTAQHSNCAACERVAGIADALQQVERETAKACVNIAHAIWENTDEATSGEWVAAEIERRIRAAYGIEE